MEINVKIKTESKGKGQKWLFEITAYSVKNAKDIARLANSIFGEALMVAWTEEAPYLVKFQVTFPSSAGSLRIGRFLTRLAQ